VDADAERVYSKLQEQAIELATLTSELRAVGLTVTGLARALREGNGEDSLLTRVAILQKEMDELRAARRDLYDSISPVKTLVNDVKELQGFRREMRGRIWMLALALIPSALAFIALGVKAWIR